MWSPGRGCHGCISNVEPRWGMRLGEVHPDLRRGPRGRAWGYLGGQLRYWTTAYASLLRDGDEGLLLCLGQRSRLGRWDA